MSRSHLILKPAFLLIMILGAWGCSSTGPKRAFPNNEGMPAHCLSFCEQIQACAEKTKQEDRSDLLCSVARCETGDKCVSRITSPTGRYHGPFQFSSASWKSLCYPVFIEKGLGQCMKKSAMNDLCCSTSCAAEVMDEKRGLKHWPACGRKAIRG